MVFSEIHDDGSMTGELMVRRGDRKLARNVGYPPQRFDPGADPFDEHDLAGRPGTSGVRSRPCDALYRIVAPEAFDRIAFADQQARIECPGGVEAIFSRPDFNFTPLSA